MISVRSLRSAVVAGAAFAFLVIPGSASAQLQNLQVLPSDMSRGEVTAIMRGFTSALGVRCSTCHVGEEGQPLNTYDMASDDKVMKLKAREMLRMMRTINEEVLAGLPGRTDGEPMVTCATCHGGLRIPMPIEDVVATTLASDGLDAAEARYAELREQYFGGRQYDFSQGHLLGMANDFQRADRLDAAERLYGMALRYFEGSTGGHLGLGAVAEAREDLAAARMHYGHVLDIDPDNAQARRRLDAIGG